MKPLDFLQFSVSDLINDIEVGPTHVPLALLGEFQKDVADFLKGTNRDIDPSQIQISIQPGSLVFVASGLLAASALWTDLAQLAAAQALTLIDPKRAAVLERWQIVARENPHRRYSVADRTGRVFLSIDANTESTKIEEVWVRVEKYLHGKIVDIGGKIKPNVHLETDNGQTLTISASHDLLAKDERNRLYRPALLHVTAEENLHSGELRAMRLLAFETHAPEYDDAEFRRMVDRGTKAWDDVVNATEWTDSLRGGGA